MDIAGMSIALSQANLQSSIGVAVLDKAMDTTEALGSNMVQMIDAAAMERSVTPHLGGNMDIRL